MGAQAPFIKPFVNRLHMGAWESESVSKELKKKAKIK